MRAIVLVDHRSFENSTKVCVSHAYPTSKVCGSHAYPTSKVCGTQTFPTYPGSLLHFNGLWATGSGEGLPSVAVGLLGYAVGNYLGFFVGHMMQGIL